MGTAIGFCKEVLSGFEVDEMGRSWLKWAQVAALRVYCCDRGGKVVWMRIAADREGNVDELRLKLKLKSPCRLLVNAKTTYFSIQYLRLHLTS
jgi:hypothetical protein